MGWTPPQQSKCLVCEKTVFYMEKIVADEKVYHKTCFKCNECKKTLSTGTYASLDGKLFCKPHFKQLFKLKGRYNFAKSEQGARDAPSSVYAAVPKNLNAAKEVATPATPRQQEAKPAPLHAQQPTAPVSAKTAATGQSSSGILARRRQNELRKQRALEKTRQASNSRLLAARIEPSKAPEANESNSVQDNELLAENEAATAATPVLAKRPSSGRVCGAVQNRFAHLGKPSDAAVSMFLPSSRFGMCTTPIKSNGASAPSDEKTEHVSRRRSSMAADTGNNGPSAITTESEDENTTNAVASATVSRRQSALGNTRGINAGLNKPVANEYMDRHFAPVAKPVYVIKGTDPSERIRDRQSGSGDKVGGVRNLRAMFEQKRSTDTTATKSAAPNFATTKRLSSKTLADTTTTPEVAEKPVSPTKAPLSIAVAKLDEKGSSLTRSDDQSGRKDEAKEEDKNRSRRVSAVVGASKSLEAAAPKKSVLSAVAMFEQMVQSSHVSSNTMKPRVICRW